MTNRHDDEPTQEEVLSKKDHVTQGSRGLQQWGGQGEDESAEGIHDAAQHGNASMGTAERAARIGGMAPRKDQDDEDEHSH